MRTTELTAWGGILMHVETDDLIGIGLVVALIIFVCGQFVLVLYDRTPLPMELGITISTGLLGYLGKFFMRKEDSNESH